MGDDDGSGNNRLGVDIREYLERTREQRARIVKTAQMVVRRQEAENELVDGFRFSPEKFKIFENKVQDDLKQVFYPKIEAVKKRKFRKFLPKEMMVKAYSQGIRPEGRGLKKKNVEERVKRNLGIHERGVSFDIKCLFTPVLSSVSSKKSRNFSRSSVTTT
jgi:hypothetical protein